MRYTISHRQEDTAAVRWRRCRRVLPCGQYAHTSPARHAEYAALLSMRATLATRSGVDLRMKCPVHSRETKIPGTGSPQVSSYRTGSYSEVRERSTASCRGGRNAESHRHRIINKL